MTWCRSSASLRDPDAKVWTDGKRIVRAFTHEGACNWQAFYESEIYGALSAEGVLTNVWPVNDALPDIALEEGGILVEQQRIPVISYPCEWPFFTLQKAALLHLDLLSRLAIAGFTLKDATASNVQWRNGPVFIDLGSFVPRASGAIWRGYSQFCATMLFPLMLSAYVGVPFQPWLRGGPAGFSAIEAARLIGWRHAFRPGVLRDVLIQGLLQRMASGRSSADLAEITLPDNAFQQLILRLRRVVESLSDTTVSPWSRYVAIAPYQADERQAKLDCVDRWLSRLPRKPAIAWDIGANLGEYSRLAAHHCDWVVALEKDVGTANRLAIGLNAEAVPNITVLCHDFADPSPTYGWQEKERQSLEKRAPPDLVLTLAVLHHLCLGGGLNLADVVARLSDIAPLHISEFVAPEDPMAAWLAGNIGIARPDYSQERFRAAITSHGRILEECKISKTRTLFLWQVGP